MHKIFLPFVREIYMLILRQISFDLWVLLKFCYFIKFLRIFCINSEVVIKMLCSQK